MANMYTPKRKALIPIGPSIAYIPLTRGQFACVEVDDVPTLAPWNWSAAWKENTQSFYAVRSGNRGTVRTVHMHRQLLPVSDGLVPDHANGNGLDNRRLGNLRHATNRDNAYNGRTHRDNKSGFKGVVFHKGAGKWQSIIGINGKCKYLGLFLTPEAAHAAYRRAATEAAGEFARFA